MNGYNNNYKGNIKVRKPAVFIDRDGTINEQMGYINHISRFSLLPRSAEAIRLLNSKGYLTIVVSNQSGVARGYFPIELVNQVNEHMRNLLKAENANIDGIFFCPHHPHGSVPEYSFSCDCRKPKTGLIEKACKSFDIDLKRSFVIGDTYTDIEMSHRANVNGILVKTGYGLGEIEHILPNKDIKPTHISMDLFEAVQWIISQP